jgi:subtilisin family serine protease
MHSAKSGFNRSTLPLIGALALVLLALTSVNAFAQLLGGGSPIGSVGGLGGIGGGIGGPLGGGSNIGMPGTNGVPQSSNNIIGPSLNVPIGTGVPSSLPRTDTVTNTLNGAVPNATSLPGRALNGVGNTVNQAVRGAQRTAGQARRSGVPPAGEQRFIADEVVVRLPSNLTASALDDLARRHGLTRIESHRIGLTGTTFHRWRIPAGRSVPDIIRALEAETGVSAAQPNYRFTLAQSREQAAASEQQVTQYAPAKLNVPQAHRLATGDRVLIAVIDSGIDTSHPEIDGFVAASYDALNSKEPPHPHGTAMAGAIVAHARLTGIAPAARILAVRAFGARNTGAEGTTLTLLRAIDWAVAHGARVINMSFAGPSDPELALALAAARKKGIVLIAAAGNAGAKSPPLFPASDPGVIAVTAIDAEDKLFKLANRGKHIAVAAPGVAVLAPSPNGGYQISTGTSIAAAQVSGVAALLLERKPDLTPDAVRKILAATATDLGPKGRDEQFGAGLTDAFRAIQAIDAIAARGTTRNASAASNR